jgi:uncharacterized membrane protein (UPF0127 family)
MKMPRQMTRRAVVGSLGGVICAALLRRSAVAQAVIFDTTVVTLVTLSGRYDFTVKVADSGVKVQLGLRYQNSISPDGGMLFPTNIGNPGAVKVVIQGLTLTTDILFISQGGRVIELHPWVQPNSPDVVSTLPAVAALQLAGGATVRDGIAYGDRVLHAMFHQST